MRCAAPRRAPLRDVLGTALGIVPRAVAIVVDASGRPSLDGAHRASLDFNVSHAGDHALIAWAAVGVDIECCNRATDWRALTREVCAPAESAYLDSLPPAERAGAFMRVWSAKEALLKALGTGIVGGLSAFAVMPPRDGATPRRRSSSRPRPPPASRRSMRRGSTRRPAMRRALRGRVREPRSARGAHSSGASFGAA